MTAGLAALSGVLPEAAPLGQFGDPRAGAIAPAPVTREGWWIRLNPANQADNVSWRFGAARNRLMNPVRWWRNENQTEFDLPAAQRGLGVLHVAAIGLPYKAPVSFCVFFQNNGAALVEFAGEWNAQVAQDQREPACVP
jgi:hypothetical protein